MTKINLINLEDSRFLQSFTKLDIYANGLDWAHQFSLVSWDYEQWAAENAKCEADYIPAAHFRRSLFYALPIKDLAAITERMAYCLGFSSYSFKRKEDYDVCMGAINVLASRVQNDLARSGRENTFEDLPTNWRSLVREVRENYHDNKETKS